MTETHTDLLLRVAPVRERNTQQTIPDHATRSATLAQQTGLKALALWVLARNSVRNTTDQNIPEAVQQGASDAALRVAASRTCRRRRIDAGLRAQVMVVCTEFGVSLRQCGLADADLLALAEALGHHVDPDGLLRAYLRAAADRLNREYGQRRPCETAAAWCRHCGPVWLAPEVVAVLPVVGGWPRLLGCPWCHVINRDAIPRPDSPTDRPLL